MNADAYAHSKFGIPLQNRSYPRLLLGFVRSIQGLPRICLEGLLPWSAEVCIGHDSLLWTFPTSHLHTAPGKYMDQANEELPVSLSFFLI